MFMIQPVKISSKTEHFQYDVCNCKACLEEADRVEYDEDIPKKKKGSQKSLKKRYKAGDPKVGLLGEPSGKFDYYELYEYQAEFLALTTFENPLQKTKHSWKIQSSNVVGPSASPNQITAAEATLNWQSENSDVESSSYDELASNHEFEHLFMAEPEQTERVDSDIEEAASRTEAQDQTQVRNVFTNIDSKQQFTFDDIPPSKWRERSVEMLSWCFAEFQYYNIDMNGLRVEDVHADILNKEDAWTNEDPQATEWENAILFYLNNICPLRDGFELSVPTKVSPKSVPERKSKDDHPQFTMEMLNILKKFLHP
ncbi:hypothetical protein L1987_60096 [Smallanthus sonchifolius]|uniref:Uncharacterized protein n=1 Tax=Smallanthus sonchifolius TaxID=185202 RepID=A0ACB9D7I9_9ASTR|nr:hypothetical protein L1987_60096 [Smallanthus sonchifolius]